LELQVLITAKEGWGKDGEGKEKYLSFSFLHSYVKLKREQNARGHQWIFKWDCTTQ
jgi:hypothetical protein